jgi:carboxymethylenebutenolidase
VLELIELPTGIGALRAPARGRRKGGLVLVQEIFGLNANMRALASRFGEEGYEVIAPSFFDRIERDFVASYAPEGVAKGLAAVKATSWDQVAADCQAAIDLLAAPVFVAGFCWGGTVAWLASAGAARWRGWRRVAARGVAASVGFYGRLINTLLEETPKALIALHYGERDASIPPSAVAEVRAAHPGVPVRVWPAGHGFFSDRGHDHDPGVAADAWAQTEAFFAAHA